jgi:hypothetical protein
VTLPAGTTVGINGTANINVSNQPTVHIAPGTVIGVQNKDVVRSVKQSVVVQFPDGQFGGIAKLFTVPAGAALVVISGYLVDM